MKQRLSKILALLLVFVTLLTGVTPAFAAGETVEPFAYEGEEVSFISASGGTFGMFRRQEGTTAVIDGDNVVIHYVPNNKTVYGWIHWGSIEDELTKDVTINDDGTFDIKLPKSNCGWAIPVAPIRRSDETATTASQYYLAIPAEDKLEDVTPVPTAEPFPYEGEEVAFIKDDGSAMGMLAPQDGSTCVINGDNVELHIVPKNTTVYGWLHFGAIGDTELTRDVTFKDDGSFDITLPKEKCGWAIPVAPIKIKDGATTGDQYYLAIPAEDKLTPAEPERVDLVPTNEELMFKVVNAYLETTDGETEIVFALSGTGYQHVIAGTYEEAIAASVGGSHDKWIQYVTADVNCDYWTDRPTDNPPQKHYEEGVKSKYQFRIPIADLPESGTIRIPVVAVSYGRATSAEKANPQNPDYSSAFTARQFLIDLDAKTVRTGNYQDTLEATVTSNVETFAVESKGVIYTVGTPQANEYTIQPTFTMKDGTYDKAFVGTVEAAASATASIDLAEGNTFTIKLQNSLGKTPQFNINTKQVDVAFHSVDADEWIIRTLTIDADAKTITIDGEELVTDADYTAVDEALKKAEAVDKSLYTEDSVARLAEAVDAVERGLKKKDQAKVDAMAQAIEDAIAALVEADADYTAVDAAIAKVPADLTIYTEASAQAVTEAVNAVERGLKKKDQAKVDAMAQAIEDAVAALVEADADYTAVDAAIAKVPADLTLYTEESVAALHAAVNAVERGLKKSRQADVDAMAKAIENAIRDLVLLGDADYAAVNAALDKVPADLTIYTEESAQAVTDAVNAVVWGLKENEQARVDDMAQAIEDAVAALVELDADYTAVDAAIAKVPADLSIYTEASAQAVTDAVNAVERGLKKGRQADVDAMAQAIEDAIAALVEADADYTAVDAAIAKVPADLTIYTEDSARAVTEAVNAVERGLKKKDQAKVDAMAQAIEDAIAALVEADADYTAVDAAIAKVPADLSIYTEESAKAVTEAVNAVERGLKKKDQAKVDAMAQAIEDAIAALALKPTDPAGSFDNSTDLPDGEYTVPEEDFIWTGGTGKAKLTLVKVIVKDGKAVGVFAASSPNMTHAYLGKTETNEEDPRYYNPDTDTLGTDVYAIVNQSVTLPVRVNELVDISCRTVAMSAPHWVNYQYQINIDIDQPAPEEDADYSAVDAALAKIPADLSIYTESSVKTLVDAKNAVVRGLKQSEQDKVDAMAQAIEDAIAALVLKPVDGRVDLEIINTTGMFKALFAYVVTENGKSTLVVALTGSSYQYLYKGTYAQALANGDNRDNWVKGYQNEAGKWLFDFPLTDGETYIPVVSISSTYLEKYEKGENPLERSFYPRQFVLDLDAATLTVGDYDETVTAAVNSEVESFHVAETADMRVVGGPNSNNFRVAPVLQMLDDTYDQVTYPTVDGGKLTTATVELSAEKTFAIDMLNAPNLYAFRDKEPVTLQLRVKATGETVAVQMMIDMLAQTITITGEAEGGDEPEPAEESHTYRFVVGGDGVWTKGTGEPLLLTVKSTADDEGTFSRFVGVEVDGQLLDKANYEATAGSVNIALKAAYLDTLSEGEHTVTVKMTDGSISTTLTVNPAETETPGDGETPAPAEGGDVPAPAEGGDAPDTGDGNVLLWACLMLVSAAGLAAVFCEQKRRSAR